MVPRAAWKVAAKALAKGKTLEWQTVYDIYLASAVIFRRFCTNGQCEQGRPALFRKPILLCANPKGSGFYARQQSCRCSSPCGGTHLYSRERGARRCRRRFLHFFPDGFRDQTYQAWERDYKVNAHREWNRVLNQSLHKALLRRGEFEEAALRAVRIEARTNLIFRSRKWPCVTRLRVRRGLKLLLWSLRLLVRSRRARGATGDASGFFTAAQADACIHLAHRDRLRIYRTTGPHIFLKPNVTRKAALEYGFPLQYEARPNWTSYSNFLRFTEQVRRDIQDLHPRDMIDLQSFLWVQGSNEYEE